MKRRAQSSESMGNNRYGNNEKPKDKETEKSLEMIRFFELTPEQEEKLRSEIERSHDTVQIWVHTHYDQNKSLPMEEVDDYVNYTFDRSRFISTGIGEGKLPVIAFIESHPDLDPSEEVVEEHREYYQEVMEESSGHIYMVKTFFDHSVPCVENQDDILVEEADTRIDNWNAFGEKLAGLGARR